MSFETHSGITELQSSSSVNITYENLAVSATKLVFAQKPIILGFSIPVIVKPETFLNINYDMLLIILLEYIW